MMNILIYLYGGCLEKMYSREDFIHLLIIQRIIWRAHRHISTHNRNAEMHLPIDAKLVKIL